MEIIEPRRGIFYDKEREQEIHVVDVPPAPPPPFEQTIAAMIYNATWGGRPAVFRSYQSGAHLEAVLVSMARYDALLRSEDAVRQAKAEETAANPEPTGYELYYGDPCPVCGKDGWPAGSQGAAKMFHMRDNHPDDPRTPARSGSASSPLPEQPDTTNDHLVGVQGDRITMVLPPTRPMDVAEALRLAAWIVCVAEVHMPDVDEKFAAVLAAVRST